VVKKEKKQVCVCAFDVRLQKKKKNQIKITKKTRKSIEKLFKKDACV